MADAKSDVALGAISVLVGGALLVPTLQEASQVFMLPGDISPYLVPKAFLFMWVGLSAAILVKGLFALKQSGAISESRNWVAILGILVVISTATFLMSSLGYLTVAPVAVFICIILLGYRKHLINLVISVAVTFGLYFTLVQLAGLSLPRIPWI